MGQVKSSDSLPDTVETLQDEMCRQARVISEVASLTYDDFQAYLIQLNELASQCADKNGKRMVFAIKKGTDSSVLWKGTVKIACVKFHPMTEGIETCRYLTIVEFLKVFHSLQNQLIAAQQSVQSESASIHQNSDGSTSGNMSLNARKMLTPSVLLAEVDNVTNINAVDKSNVCCICWERKQNVMLPCAHSYCLPCIEQWNVSHKTCPICREQLDSTDDTWVLSEVPGSQEINDAICSTLMDLTSPSSSSR